MPELPDLTVHVEALEGRIVLDLGDALLADRPLSRLLKDDWPKTLEG